MFAVWDTLGWILYREGKLDDAESYLKAAWINIQSDTVAEHLGELEVARGRKNEALTAYQTGDSGVTSRSRAEKAAGTGGGSAESRGKIFCE